MRPLRMGTRSSQLARIQTAEAAHALTAHQVESVEVICTTQGDRDQTTSLSVFGGQGVFVRQLEEELLAGRIDVAVHSAKDIPGQMRPGTIIAAYLPRADVRDALISRDNIPFTQLPPDAQIGTSSRRRAAQLRALRPDLITTHIRGNVDTRLRKLDAPGTDEPRYDAVVLAAAGLIRLGRTERATELLSIDAVLPAPGQGAIALQVRADDSPTLAALVPINHQPTALALRAERAFLRAMGAGCSLPLAALAHIRTNEVQIVGRILNEAGTRRVEAQVSGPLDNPEAVGESLAAILNARGAEALLQEVPS